MPDRERIVEAGVAVALVLFMLGAMTVIGLTYGTETSLGERGAELMIAAIVGFVVVVTAAGAGLAYVISDPEVPDADEDDATADADAA